MTTEELVRLIEKVDALHRAPNHDPREHLPSYGCHVTIGELFSVGGVSRREVEEAIQHARLEGVPILTDGGVRVAQTAEEAFGLYRWLRARLMTQMRTAWAVRSQAMLMDRGERSRPAATPEPFPQVVLFPELDVAA